MLHQQKRAQQPRRTYKLLQGGVRRDSHCIYSCISAFALFLYPRQPVQAKAVDKRQCADPLQSDILIRTLLSHRHSSTTSQHAREPSSSAAKQAAVCTVQTYSALQTPQPVAALSKLACPAVRLWHAAARAATGQHQLCHSGHQGAVSCSRDELDADRDSMVCRRTYRIAACHGSV